MRPIWLVIAFALGSALTVCSVAEALPSDRALSKYELERIAVALDRLGHRQLTIDSAPEGKVIESIEIVPLEVFEPSDLFSVALGRGIIGLLNSLHVTTLKSVISREVLLRRGRPYDQRLAQETERNLRAFIPVSAVLVVPFVGSAPGRVRVVVVTKDLWSLRLNSYFQFVNDKLTYVSAQPQEANLLGTGSIANLNIVLTPDTVTTGLGFTNPRVGGSPIVMSASANAILDCAQRKLAGGSGFLYYGLPLYSTTAEWSWLTYVTYTNTNVHIGNGLEARSICSDGARSIAVPGLVLADPDNPTEPLVRTIPQRSIPENGPQYLVSYPLVRNEYRAESLRGQVAITRSFGAVYKYNLSFGAEALRYDTYTDGFPELTLPAFDTQTGQAASPAARFEANFLPRGGVSEVRVDPYVQLRAFENNFLRLINVETLGLAEDFRLGHDLRLRVYPAFKAVGSTSNILGLFASAGYTWPVQQGYVEALVAWDAQIGAFSPYSDPASNRTDATFTASSRFVTPDLGFGRLVTNVEYRRRVPRYLHGGLYLERTTGLRAYQLCAATVVGTEIQAGRATTTDCFIGEQLIRLNAEFRTRPLLLLSTLWGAAVFYDAGDAFTEFNLPPPGSPPQTALTSFSLRSAVGAGLRILIPQADRQVLRLDFAVPLNVNDPRGEFTFIATYAQGFGGPFAAPDVLLQ